MKNCQVYSNQFIVQGFMITQSVAIRLGTTCLGLPGLNGNCRFPQQAKQEIEIKHHLTLLAE